VFGGIIMGMAATTLFDCYYRIEPPTDLGCFVGNLQVVFGPRSENLKRDMEKHLRGGPPRAGGGAEDARRARGRAGRRLDSPDIWADGQCRCRGLEGAGGSRGLRGRIPLQKGEPRRQLN
jgi:hypothetical protein